MQKQIARFEQEREEFEGARDELEAEVLGLADAKEELESERDNVRPTPHLSTELP